MFVSDVAYAHSVDGLEPAAWETLPDHLLAVQRAAAARGRIFGLEGLAGVAGLLHDLGKASPEFQAYIRGDAASGGDHSAAGAVAAQGLWPGVAPLIAPVIAGHHAGLADGRDLADRLQRWRAACGDPGRWLGLLPALPAREALAPTRSFRPSPAAGFHWQFLIRMLFSCLVDADSAETERFVVTARGETVPRRVNAPSLSELRTRLDRFLGELAGSAPDTAVNRLRAEVLAQARAKAVLEPGLFTLTVPTGGGKTLASLAFALDHALRHGLRRIIYVIPYTSIIDQTADQFRRALGAPEAVLEHHASFDWDRGFLSDDSGGQSLTALRRAAETWDAPIVVTTAVQFFESLFANRRSRCRKLQAVPDSVVVLDEVQTLPLKLVGPCLAALRELAVNYRVSPVLCTATQPALREQDGMKGGLDIPDLRELAPDPPRLYRALKRVEVERLEGPVSDETVVARMKAADDGQMLVIVNTRAHARALYDAIRTMEGACHLTTLMCARQRRVVLSDIRQRLAAGLPVRLVATSLIEAGVDVDFPEVWRAATGLDAIAQAAGRANREGKRSRGRVVVFEPEAATVSGEIAQRWGAARPVFRAGSDPLGLEAVKAYFQELYWRKGAAALDGAMLALNGDGQNRLQGILPAIAEHAGGMAFPFAAIADGFRMIEQAMDPVVVPWRSAPDDDDAMRLLARIAAAERPARDDLRRLQSYLVPIPARWRRAWLAAGALVPVHAALGDTMLKFETLAFYDPQAGINPAEGAGMNVDDCII